MSEDSLRDVERVKAILVSRACGQPADDEQYQDLRRKLMADPQISAHLPMVVKTFRSLTEFWGFIQPKFPKYRQRREYLNEQFEPLLSKLEGKAISSEVVDEPQSKLTPLGQASQSGSAPVLFISHASSDRGLAEVLKDELESVFDGGIRVFVASVPGDIEPGADWLAEIGRNLDQAAAMVVLITPISIGRPWIWFELGATWAKMSSGKTRIYPVCIPPISASDLPEPLNRLQALSFGSDAQIGLFVDTLGTQLRVTPEGTPNICKIVEAIYADSRTPPSASAKSEAKPSSRQATVPSPIGSTLLEVSRLLERQGTVDPTKTRDRVLIAMYLLGEKGTISVTPDQLVAVGLSKLEISIAVDALRQANWLIDASTFDGLAWIPSREASLRAEALIEAV